MAGNVGDGVGHVGSVGNIVGGRGQNLHRPGLVDALTPLHVLSAVRLQTRQQALQAIDLALDLRTRRRLF